MAWLVYVIWATVLDALTDVASDHVIATEDDEDPFSKAKKRKVTSEQDLLCSCVTMFVVSVGIWIYCGFSMESNRSFWASVAAGWLYAHAMRAVMKAWELVPSTIVTPTLQLTGPTVQLLEAAMGISRLTAHDWIAFVLITCGGLAPSIDSLPQLAKASTWTRPSMRLLLKANMLYSFYFVTLSWCVDNGVTETQFVVVSNLAAVATLAVGFGSDRELWRHASRIGQVAAFPKLVSSAAECTNYLSMLLLSFAYQQHYSSGLVTAARTGLNQFTNVFLAALLHRTLRIGRPVLNFPRKLASASVVSLGLYISTLP